MLTYSSGVSIGTYCTVQVDWSKNFPCASPLQPDKTEGGNLLVSCRMRWNSCIRRHRYVFCVTLIVSGFRWYCTAKVHAPSLLTKRKCNRMVRVGAVLLP